jgi:hypothetical protein
MRAKGMTEQQKNELTEYYYNLQNKLIDSGFDPIIYNQLKGVESTLNVLNITILGVNQ